MSNSAILNGKPEWVQSLPPHWGVQKLKSFADIRFSNVDKTVVEGEEPIRLCNYTDVYYKPEIRPDLKFMEATATPEEIAKFRLRGGDVIITKDSETWDDIAVPSFVPEDIDGVICGYHLAQIRPRRHDVNGKYLYYAFAAHGIRDHFHITANGITRYGLSQHDIKSAPFPIPPREEQDAIVAFLDRKLAEIDGFIANKRRLIELLEEERQRTVFEAIARQAGDTSGGTAETPWLPSMPSGLEFQPLKRLIKPGTSISYGIVQPGEHVEDGTPFLQTTNIVKGQFNIDALQRTTPEIARSFPRSRLCGGDVILGIRASIGAAHIVPSHLEGMNLSRGIARIVPNGALTADFLVEYLRSDMALAFWRFAKQGTTFDEVSIETVKSLPVPVLSIAQQKAVVSSIRSAHEETQAVVERMEREIHLINEFRTSLIAEAVTGRLNVYVGQ